MTHWVDEDRKYLLFDRCAHGRVVEEFANKAHGLVPHKVIEVNLHTFFRSWQDIRPEDASLTDDGLSGLRSIVLGAADDRHAGSCITSA